MAESTNHHEGRADIRKGDHRGIVRNPEPRDFNHHGANSDPEPVAGQGGEGCLKQDHGNQLSAFRADGLQCTELLEVLDNEGVESLPRDRKADDETDDGHQQHIRAETGLVFVECRNLVHELGFGHGKIAHRLDAFLDRRDVARRLGLYQDVGGRKPRIRQILQRPVIGRVQSWHAEETARRHSGDTNDHRPVIVEFEFGADFRIPQLRKFCILDDDKAVLGVDVLDIALDQPRAAEEAEVIWIMRKTANVMPTNKAANLARSLTSSL